MREIKFDAIYKPTREHFNPIEINFNDNTVTGNFDENINDWCHFSLDGNYGDVILRQYTGLKDKNGVEIFEGDIIQYTGNINNGYRDLEVTRKAEVTFSLGMFWGGYGGNLAQVRKKSEVIGNIYDNPELLEGDTHA